MRNGFSGLVAGLAAFGAAAGPAAAQTGPHAPAAVKVAEARSQSQNRPTGLVFATEALAASGAGFSLGPQPLPPNFQPMRMAAPAVPSNSQAIRMAAPASPHADMAIAQAAPVEKPAAKPVPAAKPAQAPAAKPPAPSNAAAPAAKPAAPQAVAAPAPKPPATASNAPAEPLTDQEIVAKANGFFNNLGSLVAEFVQIGGDGRRLGGTLYLQRPGKARFEYDKPSTLEVIADGSSVAVQDTKLATQDLYPISQTPLKFLLRERVNLGQDIRITGIANEGDAVRLSLEDRSTFGGTSRITLFFDAKVENLSQWRIVDPQGFQTTVVLNNVERGQRLDQKLFVINVNRAINTDGNANR